MFVFVYCVPNFCANSVLAIVGLVWFGSIWFGLAWLHHDGNATGAFYIIYIYNIESTFIVQIFAIMNSYQMPYAAAAAFERFRIRFGNKSGKRAKKCAEGESERERKERKKDFLF